MLAGEEDEDSDRGAGGANAETTDKEDKGETTDDGGTFAENAFFSMKSIRKDSLIGSPQRKSTS